jgi:hypothetical protein
MPGNQITLTENKTKNIRTWIDYLVSHTAISLDCPPNPLSPSIKLASSARMTSSTGILGPDDLKFQSFLASLLGDSISSVDEGHPRAVWISFFSLSQERTDEVIFYKRCGLI